MKHSRPNRNLVTTEWLADNLGDPQISVVDGSFFLPTQKRSARSEFLAGHIPTAVFFDLEAIADRSTDLPHMLPSEEQFALDVGALGIQHDDTIVIYDSAGLSGAPRVWWTLRVFGAKDVFILDGGLPKWKAEGRPLENKLTPRQTKTFAAKLNSEAVANVNDVKTALMNNSAQVVDARSAARFRGEEPEPRAGLRSGHMPGAKNVPVTGLIERGRLVEPEKIKERFAAGGVNIDMPIITTCGSGVTAATLWFALDTIGKAPKSLYDGSWAEWGRGRDLPVETESSTSRIRTS